MKFYKIEEGKNLKLMFGHFYKLQDGGLLHTVDNKVIQVLKPDQWAQEISKTRVLPKGVFPTFRVSNELLPIVKKDGVTRTELVKLFWAYIHRKKLQDPKNRRNIMMSKDPLTKKLTKKRLISIFELTKLLSSHVTPL